MPGGRETAAWVDTLLFSLSALVMTALSWLVLALAQFNADHVFVNPGVGDAGIHGLAAWFSHVRQHQAALAGYLFSTTSMAGVLTVPAFLSPALCIAVAGGRKSRLAILALTALCLLFDVRLFLQWHGNNSANGGYDGVDFIIAGLLHVLAGVIAVGICAGRAGMRLWRLAMQRTIQ
jgi:hypothetical protein